MNGNEIKDFDSFAVNSKRNLKIHRQQITHLQNFATNIYRIEAYDSIMCGYFCLGFIDFMLNNERESDFTNSFSANNLRK